MTSFCLPSFTSYAAEITIFENYVIVYKFVQDLHFFVTGGEDENELILASVLQGFFDAVGILLRLSALLSSLGYFFVYPFLEYELSCYILWSFSSRDNVDKRGALENLDVILLCIDEIIDGG